MKFIAHHLYDQAKRESDATHGMPAGVAGALRAGGTLEIDGPHAAATVKRGLSLWGTMHKWRGLAGPVGVGQIRNALWLAIRAAALPRQRKSQNAVTGDIVEKLLAVCRRGHLTDRRDAALILATFDSGGRRRSEFAGLRVEDIVKEPDVLTDPANHNSIPLPCRWLRLGRTKTTDASDDARAYLVGKPVLVLEAWLKASLKLPLNLSTACANLGKPNSSAYCKRDRTGTGAHRQSSAHQDSAPQRSVGAERIGLVGGLINRVDAP